MGLVFLKLGGSAITDKTRDATPRHDIIRRAAREVERARSLNTDLKILLGHGSGSFGHSAARRTGFGAAGNWRSFAETGAAAARLNRLVTDIFLEEGAPVVSLQPSASARCRDGELESMEIAPIRAALEHGLIPLVYGDVSLDDTLGMSILSTEKIFIYLAPLLSPRRIVYASAVNGIFGADPVVYPNAELIPELTPSGLEAIQSGLGGGQGEDVTGGMMDKVRRNLALVEHSPRLDVYIIGSDEGLIERSLLVENFAEGTWIHGGVLAGD